MTNTALMIETFNHIVDHPEEWDQSTWSSVWLTEDYRTELLKSTDQFGVALVDLEDARRKGCRTGMCFAGWSIHLDGHKHNMVPKRLVYPSDIDPDYIAASRDYNLSLVTDKLIADQIADEVTVSCVANDDSGISGSPVATQAQLALDIMDWSHDEVDSLFSPGNTLPLLRAKVIAACVGDSLHNADRYYHPNARTKIDDDTLAAAEKIFKPQMFVATDI